jgi:hypothetical protein
MKRQTLLFIVVVATIVIMLVNPYTAQFSTAARGHHIHSQMKASKGLSGSSTSNSNNKLSSSSSSRSPTPMQSIISSNNNDGKFVIINFDDSHESGYTYAKPILDKFGFKATFFEVCNWVKAGYHESDISTTWQQIAALQQDGMQVYAGYM